MKLSEWARKEGIAYHVARNMFKAGKLPGAIQLDTGTIIIKEEEKSTTNLNFDICKLEINDNIFEEDALKNDIVSIVSYFFRKIYGLKEGNIKINKFKEIL